MTEPGAGPTTWPTSVAPQFSLSTDHTRDTFGLWSFVAGLVSAAESGFLRVVGAA